MRISLVYVVQFVGHLLGGSMVGLMAISSKRAYATGCMTQNYFNLFIYFIVNISSLWKYIEMNMVNAHITIT